MVSLGSSLGGGSNGGFGDSCKAAVGAAAATYAAPVSTATTASEGAYAAPAAVTTAASPATVAAPAYTAPATTTIAAPAVAYATPAASIIAGAPATSAAGVASTTYQISTESVGNTDGGLSGSSAGGVGGSYGCAVAAAPATCTALATTTIVAPAVTYAAPAASSINVVVSARCVLRVPKMECYLKAVGALAEIIGERAMVIKAMLFVYFHMFLVGSTFLYFTEYGNPVKSVCVGYGFVAQADWAEHLSRHSDTNSADDVRCPGRPRCCHAWLVTRTWPPIGKVIETGEWVWCDYTALGMAVCTLIAFFSNAVGMVPVPVHSDGWMSRLNHEQVLIKKTSAPVAAATVETGRCSSDIIRAARRWLIGGFFFLGVSCFFDVVTALGVQGFGGVLYHCGGPGPMCSATASCSSFSPAEASPFCLGRYIGEGPARSANQHRYLFSATEPSWRCSPHRSWVPLYAPLVRPLFHCDAGLNLWLYPLSFTSAGSYAVVNDTTVSYRTAPPGQQTVPGVQALADDWARIPPGSGWGSAAKPTSDLDGSKTWRSLQLLIEPSLEVLPLDVRLQEALRSSSTEPLEPRIVVSARVLPMLSVLAANFLATDVVPQLNAQARVGVEHTAKQIMDDVGHAAMAGSCFYP